MGGAVGIDERVRNMRDAAAYVCDELGGSLDAACAKPVREAKRALQKIRGIGEPGAEKILLLLRRHKLFPLDSNGARSLVRMGYGADHKNYSTMYKSVQDAARPELVDDFDWLIDAHVLLRHHGRELCKTSEPHCEACPVSGHCAYARAWRRSRPTKDSTLTLARAKSPMPKRRKS